MKPQIADAGETIPYAHKHRGLEKEAVKREGVSLSDIWPEPDWMSWIAEGRSHTVVASLAVIYSGLATRPKGRSHSCSAEGWRTAFEGAVALVRALFERARTMEDVASLSVDLAAAIGFDERDLRNMTVEDRRAQQYLALGRGSRWLKGPFTLTLRQEALAKWLPELGWPENARAFDLAIVPVEMTDKTWAVGRVEGNGYAMLVDQIPTRSEAIASAIQHIAKGTTTVGANRAIRVKQVDRAGVDYRDGRDIAPDELIGVFGFRGIQFGESLGQSERQAWVNELYDAPHDMAVFLGLKPRWIGLRGLGLAVGARGVGKALAHYEPGLRCFNYTRKRGAGSIAHEWWHALDAYLVQWVAPSQFKRSRGYLSLWEEAFGAAKHPSAPQVLPALSGILAFADSRQQSQFLRDAWKISNMPRQGDYWYQRHEMVARAFEAYVQDGLAAQQKISPYLVLGTSEQEMDEEDSHLRAYPVGEERRVMNGHFDTIFAALKGVA